MIETRSSFAICCLLLPNPLCPHRTNRSIYKKTWEYISPCIIYVKGGCSLLYTHSRAHVHNINRSRKWADPRVNRAWLVETVSLRFTMLKLKSLSPAYTLMAYLGREFKQHCFLFLSSPLFSLFFYRFFSFFYSSVSLLVSHRSRAFASLIYLFLFLPPFFFILLFNLLLRLYAPNEKAHQDSSRSCAKSLRVPDEPARATSDWKISFKQANRWKNELQIATNL